ncbi:hypothetical protein ZIOFF_008487 [Zingiber officinale]|uniref:Uncharacterized protein n=1 Tax=Zingiber officinale TaxID=94328 RepID=A0A8J5LTR8_ZINOF|nr:hypothetical protein ZIOFF_008487 [Zingiber officinale]
MFERRTPPVGYVCHRCKVPGHVIQHFPTNGDPNYDIKRVKPPTGIPKSMLMATPDGSYSLPSGAVVVLNPNEAAFEKGIEGLPTTHPVGGLPPELWCQLCRGIRDYIMTKLMCICGATNILMDALLPNKTLKETINRILVSATSSTKNAGSLVQVQGSTKGETEHYRLARSTEGETEHYRLMEHTCSSAGIQFDELVDGLRRGVAVLEHPKEVLEQHHLAAYDDGGARVGGGATGEDLEEAVLDKGAADEVPSAGLADVDGVENGGGAAVTLGTAVVGRDEAAAGVPPLEHGLDPVELSGHEFA